MFKCLITNEQQKFRNANFQGIKLWAHPSSWIIENIFQIDQQSASAKIDVIKGQNLCIPLFLCTNFKQS